MRVAVVHREGVQIHWRVAAAQRAKINGPPFNTAAQQRLVDLRGQFKPVAGLGVQALAQRRTRRHRLQPQRAHEKSVTPKALDGVKVVLAQAQQPEVALEDVAIGNARADREGRIDQRVDIDALEVLANEGQSGVRTQVVGQSFDKKVGHVLSSPAG